MSDLLELLKLYAAIFYVMFYPVFIVALVLGFNIGVFSYLLIIICLAPPTLLWYCTVKARLNRFLALLQFPHGVRDMQQVLDEYMQLLKRQKHV